MGHERWIHDITAPIQTGMIVYSGDPPVRLERTASVAHGDPANVSRIDFGVHTGTHVDAPLHFHDGARGVDAVDLHALIGPAQVVDATQQHAHIDAHALSVLPIEDGCERVIFKTTNSRLWDLDAFSSDFIGLTEDAGHALVERGVRLVGIDYLSIGPYQDPAPTHLALLDAGAVILEGLDLRTVEPGMYELICLPLRIVDCDGAPARAVLRELD